SPLGGATAILVAGTTVKRDYYAQINHNIIQTGWGLNGIQLQNVMKYQLADNDIEMGNNALNDYGISVEGCNLVQVNCNHVHYNTNGQPPAPCYDPNTGTVLAPFDAIHAMQSVECTYHCNTTEGTCNGLRFNMNCSGSTVEANEIGNHATGLYLDANAVIGEQPVIIDPNTPLNGNRWVGSYVNGWGARNWNVNPAGSVFTVNNTVDGFHLPASVLPNSGWFNNNLAFLNFVSCNPVACEGYTGNEVGFGEGQRAVAEGELNFDTYPYENNRWYDRILYELMEKYPERWGGDSLYQAFYDSVLITTLHPLVDLQTERENITENQPDLTELWSVSDSLTRMIVYYDSLLRVVPPADTANIDSILNVLHSELGTIIHSMEVLMQSANDTRLTQSEWLAAQNLSLTLTDTHQQFEQTVNDIYLNTYARGNFLLDSMHRVTLEEIADLCPIVGGPGVFMARSMLSVYGVRVYEDETTCLGQGYTMRQSGGRSDEPKKAETLNTISIYPNPTSGSFKVVLSEPLISETPMRIYNTEMKEVGKFELKTDWKEYEIQLEKSLPEGVYFYFIGSHRGKIILQK
ncbi:MAG: T9SS type A sorting domain-containing protein, partial [Bacteroidia bacterium]|nr:T9SS type A sorting domain-containing protein [Bacteroidia bacterium]